MIRFLIIAALMVAPACGELPQPANADRGTGRVLAQLPTATRAAGNVFPKRRIINVISWEYRGKAG